MTRNSDTVSTPTRRRRRWASPALALGLLAAAVAPAAAQDTPELTEAVSHEEGFTIRFPRDWSQARDANVQMLFKERESRVRSMRGPALDQTTRIMVFTEQRADHAEALRALKEIEAETDSPCTWLAIGGWPGLQRRHLATKPQPGQEEPPRGGEPEQVLIVTTAVAAGDLLVRVEGRLRPDAPPEHVAEVEAIGRGLEFPERGDPDAVARELEQLRGEAAPRFLPPPASGNPGGAAGPAVVRVNAPGEPDAQLGSLAPAAAASGIPGPGAPAAGAPLRVAGGGGIDSEIEIIASTDGRDIVIGTNNRYHVSNDGGQTFNQIAGLNGNDPSLAFGVSGTFYAANIALAAGATAISSSNNNGANFNFLANAFVCPPAGPNVCPAGFPDQEHIAADRFTAAPGGDQVYSTWRHLDGRNGIVCSADGGLNWGNLSFTNGDVPRITVGQNGTVYVVYRQGNNVRVRRYTSCAAGLVPLPPVTVAAGINDVVCPVPGLDRCNNGNLLSSHTVAVDDTDPSHVYVAYAVSTGAGNEAIVVQDSLDGGATWPAARAVTINSGFIARRFMPWVCTAGGTAHVTWFDTRFATAANNDLADFFRGSAFLDAGGDLTAGPEVRLNEPGTSDSLCAAGRGPASPASWPFTLRNPSIVPPGDSESCSVQPQLGGRCCTVPLNQFVACPAGSGSGQPCDFSDAAGAGAFGCPAGETCRARSGAPKYGDYNGNACAAGRLYAAWASGTSPPSIAPASTSVDLFFAGQLLCCVPQIQVPGSVDAGLACVGATSEGTLEVCNTGKEDLLVDAIASSDPQFAVTTPSAGWPVAVSPDFCFPFEVQFTPAGEGPQGGTLTVPSNDPMNPTVDVAVSGEGGVGDIRLTGSPEFGGVCAGDLAEGTFGVCNTGRCDLQVAAATVACPDFTVVASPFPARVSPDSCLDVTVQFTPTTMGAKACDLDVASDDPDSPTASVGLTASTPPASIGVSGDLSFPPTVIQSLAACSAEEPFPVANTGTCPLEVTDISVTGGGAEYRLRGRPPFPLRLEPGHLAGSGDLEVVFEPREIGRARTGEVSVTFVSEPVVGTTATVSRDLCGEGVARGARVLVTRSGVPMAQVDSIRIKGPRDTLPREQRDVALQSVLAAPPCPGFQYHLEWGGESNPEPLGPGVHELTVSTRIGGHNVRRSVQFEIGNCDFLGTLVVDMD